MYNDKINDLSLLNKYQSLLIENDKLKAENKKLKAQLKIRNPSSGVASTTEMPAAVIADDKGEISSKNLFDIPTQSKHIFAINQKSKSNEKIKLFASLFKGRDDVYAKRWQNKEGKSGYAPACFNEWKTGLCYKPKIKCSECINKSFEILNEKVIEEHLKGNIVAGIYPMQLDETCYFLAIDFDDDGLPADRSIRQTGWNKDISVLRDVCTELDIPFAVERSRSGNGAHVWFFFEEPISAVLARRFGTSLLTYSMNKRHEIKFKSYDRFFPNQDTIPKGGFGNLIALPLQMTARKKGNSVFIDEHSKPYSDQWEFLSSIKKLSENKVETLITNQFATKNGNELGVLRRDDEENPKPWEKIPKVFLTRDDFPNKVTLVKTNMLYASKTGISQRALNNLKRLAAFKNPEFYKTQAMRMPTYNKPRIISCSDETNEYLCLPRGCEADVRSLLNKLDVDIEIVDKTNHGRKINVEFNGNLRDDQLTAINELIKCDNGVLAAATAFGKTVIAAKLIAQRKTNTLVLVHRQQLLAQWITRLSEFLNIKEELPTLEKKRGRQKQQSLMVHRKIRWQKLLSKILDNSEKEECTINHTSDSLSEQFQFSMKTFYSSIGSFVLKIIFDTSEMTFNGLCRHFHFSQSC